MKLNLNNYKNVRFWDATKKDFKYPETDTTDELCYKRITTLPNSGICISGGGTVSASVIAGYFAALEELGLMEKIRYVSGVSGGAWGSAPYCYMQTPDALFGNRKVMPQEITPGDLEKTGNPNDVKGCMTYAVNRADIVDRTLAHTTPVDNQAYEEAVGDIFLHPFDIESPAVISDRNPFGRRHFFTSDNDAATKIGARNGIRPDQFMTMAANRPFPIMNTTMFVPKRKGDYRDNYTYHFEFTPLYCGMRSVQTPSPDGQQIGGAYVEPFGFNSKLKKIDGDHAEADNLFRFELCQPVGTSGAAIQEYLERDARMLLEYFPKFDYWNPLQSTVQTENYGFGDGGIVEDTGVISLLTRGVQNIGIFLTEPVFFPHIDKVGDSGWKERAFGYNQIASLFGDNLIDVHTSELQHSIVFKPADPAKTVFANQVGASNNFQSVLTALWQAKTGGGPLITASMQLDVIPNSFYGITTGYKANAMWVVIDTCDNWWNNLKPEVQSDMAARDEFKDFPAVKVFGQNKDHLIELTVGQANQLGNLAYWMVKNKGDQFQALLG